MRAAKIAFVLLWAVCSAARADLPPETRVRAALESAPEVLAARRGIEAEVANRDRLRAGPYEFAIRGALQRRDERGVERYGEQALALERPLRWFGKADKDVELGERGISVASAMHEDAMHEASRALLRLWFDWLRERDTVELWRAQAGLLADQLSVVERRLRAGDVARMERGLAQGALDQANAQLAQAQLREQAARVALETRFPGVLEPGIRLGDPEEPGEALAGEAAVQALVERNHELRVARLDAQRLGALAERLGLERKPDPTVGVYYSNERGGAERVSGLSVSLPFPGEARVATERAARASAMQASDRTLAVERKVRAEALQTVSSATLGRESWLKLRAALEAARENVRAVTRGYELGETALPNVLLAKRLEIETAQQEVAARAEARHALWRLRLDLHTLWAFDDHANGDAGMKAR